MSSSFWPICCLGGLFRMNRTTLLLYLGCFSTCHKVTCFFTDDFDDRERAWHSAHGVG